jgi:hypothetical protein
MRSSQGCASTPAAALARLHPALLSSPKKNKKEKTKQKRPGGSNRRIVKLWSREGFEVH